MDKETKGGLIINLTEHFHMTWKEYPRQEWVLRFIHTMEMVPRNWYTLAELRQGTIKWESLVTRFTQIFEFTSEHPTVDVALQIMKEKIFEEIPVATTNYHQCSTTVHHWMESYNVTGELHDDDLLDINIPELEGTRAVEGSDISSIQLLKPLKIKKVNIGLRENPTFSN